MTVNVELFINVLAHIERDPNAWNQSHWLDLAINDNKICATAGCMAGWACLLGDPTGKPELSWFNRTQLLQFGVEDVSGWITADGEDHQIDIYAEKLLGLDSIPADYESDAYSAKEWLFAGGNSMDQLYEHSATLCGMDVAELRAKVAERVAGLDKQAVERALRSHAVPVS